MTRNTTRGIELQPSGCQVHIDQYMPSAAERLHSKCASNAPKQPHVLYLFTSREDLNGRDREYLRVTPKVALLLRRLWAALDSDGIEAVQNSCAEVRLAGVQCRRRCHAFAHAVRELSRCRYGRHVQGATLSHLMIAALLTLTLVPGTC